MSTTSYALAFSGPEHDLAPPDPDQPVRTYIVASTPRCGSNMLSDGLRQTGVLGMPLEYLELDVLGDALAARWGAEDFNAYLAALYHNRTDAGGTFGIKIHWHQLTRFYTELCGHSYGPGFEQDLMDVTRTLFGEPRWVFLQRRDRDSQAVSMVKAQATGRFVDLGGKKADGEVPFDYRAIHNARAGLDASIAGWEQFFFLNDITPHRVTYEDLVSSYEPTLRKVCDFLGASSVDVEAPTTRKQATAGANPHVVRYRRERRALATAGTSADTTSSMTQAALPGNTTKDGATPPRFVIAGTGRCGSGFISKALQAAGVSCGHEQFFGPPGHQPRGGLDGDSSWLAVPYLEEYDGKVLLQLRHPLDVIRSLVGIGMFSDPSHGAYQRFAFAHLAGLTGTDDLTDAMRWYVEWNERAEASADLVYRVEDVDAALLQKIAAAGGVTITRAAAQKALAAVPSNFNGRRRADVEWDQLPAGDLRDRIEAFARRHGYDV